MKKVVLLSICILVMTLPIHVKPSLAGKNEQIEEECKRKIKETREEYSRLVTNDVLHSFDLFNNEDMENYIYFTARDLWKNQFLVGNNEMFNSLKKLMAGSYRGEKRLYFIERNPNIGYILFRNVDNQNVMVKVHRGENEWVEVEKKIKKGKQFAMEEIKCGDQHFMQKMFDNLYP